jgi:hypothetical protein
MNLLSLKQGMLIRDRGETDKLLEVVRVRSTSATAVVLLEDLKPVKGPTQQITYSTEGVWQFMATPTEKQIAALEAVRNEKLGLAAVLADVIDVEGQEGDGELKAGDRVSWERDGTYRVYGVFWKHVRGYCICVSTVTQQRVALKPGQLTRECG